MQILYDITILVNSKSQDFLDFYYFTPYFYLTRPSFSGY